MEVRRKTSYKSSDLLTHDCVGGCEPGEGGCKPGEGGCEPGEGISVCAFLPFRIFFDFLTAFKNLTMLNFLKMCLRLDHSSDAAWSFCFFSSLSTVLSTLGLFLVKRNVRLWTALLTPLCWIFISVHFAWSLSP